MKLLSPRVAQQELERLVKRAADVGDVDTSFQMLPEGSRDLIAYERFGALVREAERRQLRE